MFKKMYEAPVIGATGGKIIASIDNEIIGKMLFHITESYFRITSFYVKDEHRPIQADENSAYARKIRRQLMQQFYAAFGDQLENKYIYLESSSLSSALDFEPEEFTYYGIRLPKFEEFDDVADLAKSKWVKKVRKESR